MIIDFSMSIEDWMELFNRFISIIENFFKELGIKLFSDEEETSPEETTVA